jgi:hypothetical protein
MKRETIILGYEENIPVILCKERTDAPITGAMKFYCEFCRKNHNHGIGEGHRIAHCHNPKSPFDKTGYIITLNPCYIKNG